MRQDRLRQLTDRWRRRRDAHRPAVADRPRADDERQALAARAFPWRETSPAAYVAAHGGAMGGYTYDEERFDDPALDAWLLEVGRLLRARR